MSELANLSLADLAGFDATDVKELRVESLPEGTYVFSVDSAVLTEGADKDSNKVFIATFTLNVNECIAAVDRSVDKDSLVGKKFRESRRISTTDQTKMLEGIGYLRGFVSDIGADSTGQIGGVEGGTPGFLENSVGVTFTGRIKHKKDKSGDVWPRLEIVK